MNTAVTVPTYFVAALVRPPFALRTSMLEGSDNQTTNKNIKYTFFFFFFYNRGFDQIRILKLFFTCYKSDSDY